MNNNSYIKRLTYSKYIYLNGVENLQKRTSISCAIAVLMFHDASEQFLMIIADKLGFKVPFGYMEYWEEAKKKGKSLPNKNDMQKLNKIRVNFKHYGIIPTFDDCRSVQHILLDFFIKVSNDLLNTDFNKVSLTDLIEYTDVKTFLKKAEMYLEEGKCNESIVESAKAFALFEKRTEGDVWHSHILKEERFGSLHTFELRKVKNEMIYKALVEIENRLKSITKNLNVVILGIDTFKYQKFKLLTPYISISMTGKMSEGGIGSAFRNVRNLNEENAQFCINFVIDSALKFQENPIGLFNINKPHTIKTNSLDTKLYTYQEKVFKESRIIGKDEVFENAKLTFVKEKKDSYWKVNYEGSEGFLERKDVDWIEETKQPFLYQEK